MIHIAIVACIYKSKLVSHSLVLHALLGSFVAMLQRNLRKSCGVFLLRILISLMSWPLDHLVGHLDTAYIPKP